GQCDKLRGKVKEKWGQLTDDDLMIVGGNVDELVGRIHEKTGVARETVEHFIADLASHSSSTLNQALEAAMGFAEDASGRFREGAQRMRAGYEQVSDQVRERYDQVNERVRENPGQSMMAVFGLGMITGIALGLMFRSSSDSSFK
ncbi:MAG: CsbD family protein, partial [Candidatus Saccharimonadales bacterium]